MEKKRRREVYYGEKMTWLTHTTFAYLTGALFGLNPYFAVAGSTAPDWAEDFLGIKEHRGITHYLTLWAGAFIFSIILYGSFKNGTTFNLLSFIYGSLTHLLLDSLTISGIPLGVGKIRVRIGGLIKTGKLSEWIFLGITLAVFYPLTHMGATFGLFPAKELYQKGIIDLKEYRELRFRLW